MNFGATLEVPLIFFCRNNLFAISTPVEEVSAKNRELYCFSSKKQKKILKKNLLAISRRWHLCSRRWLWHENIKVLKFYLKTSSFDTQSLFF